MLYDGRVGRRVGLVMAMTVGLAVQADPIAGVVPQVRARAESLVHAGGGRMPLELPMLAERAVGGTRNVQRAALLTRTSIDHDDSYAYRLPYADGATYPVIQSYGARLSHRGAEYYTVDFGMPVGTPIHAAREGIVVLVEDGNDGACWREGCERLANFVVVLHSDGTTGEYFHLQRGSAQVCVGQAVERGQSIARSGNTGYSTAPHLHFGVYHKTANGSSESLPVRFLTRMGSIAIPRSGAYYLNPRP